MDLNEPAVGLQDVLRLEDPLFNTGNVCIVTGAGTGIGRATSIAAAVNGLTVLGVDISEQEAEKTCKMAGDLGGTMHFLKADLTADADIEKTVSRAAELGAVKYLINIAGTQHIDSVENFPMEKYDMMQHLMLRAPFYLSKLAIPRMKNTQDGIGVIANMASVHGHITTRNKPVYNITKFGLRGLSQSISAEGEGRIRSFTVSTGYVKTPLALNQIPQQARQRGISQEEVVTDVMMGNSRVKEMMTPVEVANLFIFGISRHGSYLVGGDLLFDGGMVLTY
ncbi:MAG: SDR family NAD(P)-dependent oxidoreductase [Desulfobacterales bacterium]